jgi:hypothetical protein
VVDRIVLGTMTSSRSNSVKDSRKHRLCKSNQIKSNQQCLDVKGLIIVMVVVCYE